MGYITLNALQYTTINTETGCYLERAFLFFVRSSSNLLLSILLLARKKLDIPAVSTTTLGWEDIVGPPPRKSQRYITYHPIPTALILKRISASLSQYFLSASLSCYQQRAGEERVKDIRDVMLLAQIKRAACTEAKKPKDRLTFSSFANSAGSRCSRNTVEKTLHLLHREYRCRLWSRSTARKRPLNPFKRYKGLTFHATTISLEIYYYETLARPSRQARLKLKLLSFLQSLFWRVECSRCL